MERRVCQRLACSMSPSPNMNAVYGKKIHLADGGLGSTLEGTLNLEIAHTPLWSTRAAVDKEKSQLLLQAHLSFLRAGARTLLTSTYQAAFNTFEREGYSRDQALEIMSNAVSIADRARALFCAESKHASPNDICIVLSLGTFGSTVSSMHDFDGIFPPPYGPKAYSATEANRTSFGTDMEGLESSVRALADFHAERLWAYAQMSDIWNLVDAIAFETVPVAREVTAIRRAVTRVAAVLGTQGRQMKAWWVSAVFPHGRCSETHGLGGEGMRATEVADLMVRGGVDGQGRALEIPSGIGFNCVGVEYLNALLDQFEEVCGRVIGDGGEWPWLTMKPNGSGDQVGWAHGVMECVIKARGQRWGGLVVGGCCNAGPEHIARLAAELDRGN